MSLYTRLQKTANKLIKDKGQSITLTHVTPGTYNPATGGVTNTTSTQTVYGAIIEWETRHIDGNLIRATDKLLLLSPFKTDGTALTAPVLGDTVTDAAGVTYTLVNPLNTTAPAGTIIFFECNLRA